MTTQRDEPLFVISVAARMAGVHAQTLRYYERSGLIAPSRSEGNRRYYSERDLERIRRIKTMMGDMGYEVLSEIGSLPRRLPYLYKRLTV